MDRTYTFDFASPSTVSLAVSAVSGRVALTMTNVLNGYPADTVVVYNSGTVPVFIVKGDVTVVATVAGFCIPPGAIVSIALGPTTLNTYIAAISASGTPTVYFSGCRVA